MDTIANMLTTIINAQRVGKQRVALPYSRFKESLAELLKTKGLVGSVRVQDGPRPKLVVSLAYDDGGNARIQGAKRLSTPGRRVYVQHRDIPRSVSASGAVIISTPQGLMDDAAARKNGVGGELVCEIW